MLWLKDVSPYLFHHLFEIAKMIGASVVDVSVGSVLTVQNLIDSVVVGLRDPADPHTAMMYEPLLKLGFNITFFIMVVAASDTFGRRLTVLLRPVFVVPLMIGTNVIALAFDDIRDNNHYVDVAGGLFVLWLAFGFGMYHFEGWLAARVAKLLQQNRERHRRESARAEIARAQESERERRQAAVRAGQENDDECPICLVSFAQDACQEEFGDRWRVDGERSELPCGHALHSGCGREWLSRSLTCPMCRQPISRAGRVFQRLFSVR